MADFTIKRNDTKPYLAASLVSNGLAYPLAGANVKLIMRLPNTALPKVDSPAVILDEVEGLVEYRWTTGDTDTEGNYQAEWEVTDSEGKIITFPNDTYFSVLITEDLG